MSTNQEHQPKKKLFVKLERMIALNKINKKFLYLLIFSLLILAAFIIFQAKDYIPFNNEFSRTGDMNLPRYGHSAVLLKDGRVFIAGGVFRMKRSVYDSNIQEHLTAEVYEPKSGKFKIIGKMNSTHDGSPILTLLNNGKVLVIGGKLKNNMSNQAELFDPITNKFEYTGSLKIPRSRYFSATKLKDGKVLVTGGLYEKQNVLKFKILKSAEVYIPETGKFKFTSDLIEPRWEHSSILLKNGKVLIVGGDTN